MFTKGGILKWDGLSWFDLNNMNANPDTFHLFCLVIIIIVRLLYSLYYFTSVRLLKVMKLLGVKLIVS